MNVYDFDHTIYDGDCTLDFWVYCIKKYPITLTALPRAAFFAGLFVCKCCTREIFKEKFYSLLSLVPDIEKEIPLFWDTHMVKVKEFYKSQRQSDDLVISASPEFLISEACNRLGISYIASKVNAFTGRLEGENCRGEEKWRRFKSAYPNAEIDLFYSDSHSDQPLADKAKKAYFVNKRMIEEWR